METNATASRWARLSVVRSCTDDDHTWSQLYDSLVRDPMRSAPQDRAAWRVFDPEGILDRLERVAREHDLIDGDAPQLDPMRALAEMVLASPPLKEMR